MKLLGTMKTEEKKRKSKKKDNVKKKEGDFESSGYLTEEFSTFNTHKNIF